MALALLLVLCAAPISSRIKERREAIRQTEGVWSEPLSERPSVHLVFRGLSRMHRTKLTLDGSASAINVRLLQQDFVVLARPI
jgi:hypothetical protein